MSLISRLFRKPQPQPAVAASASEPTPAAPPRPDPQVVARAEEASIEQALGAGDMAALGRLVIEGSTTHVRQRAAQAITEPGQVLELIRAARGKDKHVYRILTAKRDEHLARERAARERELEVAAAAAAVEQHSARDWSAGYAPTLARLEARWAAAAPHATDAQRQQVAAHLQRAHAVLADHAQQEATAAERHRAAEQVQAEARRARELETQQAQAEAAERTQLLEAEHAAEREAARAKREADDAAVAELVGLLRQAQAALGHGGTARAARLRDALKARLTEAPAHVLPAWFGRKLEELDARIGELQDWNTFTVVPKRAELVRRMQALIGADMSAEELARNVRKLRQEWRTLHRGAAGEPGPEREEFEQLSERAYEPCREHFAQQAAQRKENQARRESILERLQAFVDRQQQAAQEATDWRLVQQVLVEARREWRECAPVDQDAVKPLQDRLHALLDPLQAGLDAEYAANAQAKRDLIAQAERLTSDSDVRRAMDEARELQRTWKSVGFVRRKEADALWEEFRRHCDTVFERGAQEAAAYGASLESQRVRAIAICEELERIAAMRDTAPGGEARQLGTLRGEFDALELPRAGARELRQRYQRALQSCEDALQRDRAAAGRRGWIKAFRVAALISDYQKAIVSGLPADEVESRRVAAAAGLDALQDAPKAARAALEHRLAAAPDTAVENSAEAAVQLRLLCIRAEVAAGVDSPPEDQELRRELQMQRLVAAMSEGRQAESLVDLALQWLATCPVGDDDALWRRFERCLERAPGP